MYAQGPESSQKRPCAVLVDRVARDEVEAVTDAEVLQEFLHRYWHLSKPEIGIGMVRHACVALGPSRIVPVTGDTLRAAADLLERYPNLSPRDLIHVAAMQEAGVTRICTYDQGFDAVPGIRRTEPAALLAEL